MQTVESVGHLVYLEKLWLGKNRIKEITNMSELKNLRILSLQVNNSIYMLSQLALEQFYF